MHGVLAFTEANWLALSPIIGCLVSFGGLFTYLIVKTLTGHQQKMAELMRRSNTDPKLDEEIQGLRNQVSMLQDRLNDVSIKLDGGPASLSIPPTTPLPEAERLRGSA